MTVPRPYPSPSPAPSRRAAEGALFAACLFWGCGFTWAKAAGSALNSAAGAAAGSPFGPVLLLAFRFLIAGSIWVALFPRSRRGWSGRGLGRSVFLGLLLGSALILQHVGLDRTSESVSAFLTSLTILFVPLLMTLAVRRRPRGTLWVGVALATVGIWLLTGAPTRLSAGGTGGTGGAGGGFGLGEFLGLCCSIAYSFHIICVNLIVPRDDPWRMTAGQFLTAGLLCLAACAFLRGHAGPHLPPAEWARLVLAPGVTLNLMLLTIFPTILSFGSLTHFQPRLDPTRATLIYLMEPIFAAAFAYAASPARPTLGAVELAGAALILAANAVGELFDARRAKTLQGPEWTKTETS